METSLHQQLKLHYAGDVARTEVVLGPYRIDAIRDDELIEVQCASLAAIRTKIQSLLKRHTVRIIKPLVMRTRIAKRKTAKGKITSRRMSPKRGDLLDLFDDLIYFTRVFPHENLTLELVLVQVEQVRVPCRRRRRRWQKDYRVQDVRLETIESTVQLRTAGDLLDLVGMKDHCGEFTTEDIAAVTGRPRWYAQKIAYVLKHTAAIEAVARKRTGIIYRAA
ncbi:hypothetical protein FYK55_07480 [Roseiconus nitratireducens]|uniref:DUF8091 domain-containing protein n=1 Tax=Roseiconus nitratireducens TaxID=2605748 RepID=A0A5M6DGS3_9BACT|nr:hypothetical protein [Roseiconus nitratireducens]KAA5545480.1 hypothetical protein FYK55_07480 [Roseiconus nitratireducens]